MADYVSADRPAAALQDEWVSASGTSVFYINKIHSTWSPPYNYRTRPVAVLGAGVLGRRIGCIWASAGYTEHLRDPDPNQLSQILLDAKRRTEERYGADILRRQGHCIGILGSGVDQHEEQCILSGLPEPIDVEIDEDSAELYWTNGGELPLGNALYRVKLDSNGHPEGKPEIVVRGLHEAIV
ncbi:hypothetical protein BJX62DRAFT_244326 [Aspergillus germanicus]